MAEKRPGHKTAIMERVKPFILHTFYVNKGYAADFKCPTCGRVVRSSLNYMGQRIPTCNGKKMKIEPKGATIE